MNIKHRTVGVAMCCLVLVLTAGCIVEQRPVVMAPLPPRVGIAQPPPSLLQKAERGDAVAQFTLGSCYANGRGAPQNYQEAVKWYYLSAIQDYAPAQNRLGICYYRGLGTPQNYVQAVLWYRKAAIQGNSAAEDNLGICYFSGRGVTQDLAAATRWYRLAAAQGNQAAVAHLRQTQSPGGAGLAVSRQTTLNPPVAAPAPPAEPAEGSSGSPITLDEIKELSSAGVKADTLTDQIKSTHSRFSPQEIAAAEQARVDPAVIECMKENSR